MVLENTFSFDFAFIKAHWSRCSKNIGNPVLCLSPATLRSQTMHPTVKGHAEGAGAASHLTSPGLVLSQWGFIDLTCV